MNDRQQRLGDGMDAVGRVLDFFGVDMTREGALKMMELSARIATGRRPGEALREMAREYGTYYLAVNSQMRAACRPILEAEADALEAAGLRLKKRTPCALGEALAIFYDL